MYKTWQFINMQINSGFTGHWLRINAVIYDDIQLPTIYTVQTHHAYLLSQISLKQGYKMLADCQQNLLKKTFRHKTVRKFELPTTCIKRAHSYSVVTELG